MGKYKIVKKITKRGKISYVLIDVKTKKQKRRSTFKTHSDGVIVVLDCSHLGEITSFESLDLIDDIVKLDIPVCFSSDMKDRKGNIVSYKMHVAQEINKNRDIFLEKALLELGLAGDISMAIYDEENIFGKIYTPYGKIIFYSRKEIFVILDKLFNDGFITFLEKETLIDSILESNLPEELPTQQIKKYSLILN